MAHPTKSKRSLNQSSGSTFTIDAPWLLPTQSTGRGPLSSTNTRRTLVERGSRYSVIWPDLVSSRATRSLSIEPVHTSRAPLVGTTSTGMPHLLGSLTSLVSADLGSNRPIELEPYCANHSRFWSSTRPRRGFEPLVGVS